MADIVDIIDRVLDDYQVSDDAMRWTPDRLPEDTTPAPIEATCAFCVPIDGYVTAHAHPDGRLVACKPLRCPGCMGCERVDET